MSNHTIFIADLHLSQDIPKTKEIFDRLVNEITEETDALYILGDLFQFWVGDDDRSFFNEEVKITLKKISNKTPIYLMNGNRDFLLDGTFSEESGCILISDPFAFDLYGKRTLLTHGDLLCTKNVKYRLFRFLIRIPFGLKIFLKFPLKFRTWFARNLQKYSAKSKKKKSKKTLAPQLTAAKKLLTNFKAQQIIHGHIHIEETEEFTFNNKKSIRISLGEWSNKGRLLIYKKDHSFGFSPLT